MTRRLFVLTGASRGMGAAIAEQLLAREHTLLCISRHRSDALAAAADAAGASCEQWPLDLAQPSDVAAQLERWLASQDPKFAAFHIAVRQARAEGRLSAQGTPLTKDPRFWLLCGPGREEYHADGTVAKEGWAKPGRREAQRGGAYGNCALPWRGCVA